MAGAVDLAAVKARSEAAARAAQAPAPTPSAEPVTVTEANFQGEILDRSFQLPVVLAVTSTRAPDSATLMGDLESIAAAAGGVFLLAEVDADANPRIAQALQLRAIPAVFAVISGQLVPGFEGVPPVEQISEFLAAVIQAAREAGMEINLGPAEDEAVAEEPELPEDPRFDAAEAALAEGDYALAKQGFQAILDLEPGNSEAALALRQVDLLARVESTDPSLAARAEAEPDDVEVQLAAADVELISERTEEALRRLLDLIVRVSGSDRDAVRTRLVDFFDILGPEDVRVEPARREMARALF
jgi:putative thioredoxin